MIRPVNAETIREVIGRRMTADLSSTAHDEACHAGPQRLLLPPRQLRPPRSQALVDACKKYLADHPGVVFFAAGTLNHELNRPVNDRDFDVALHVVFDSQGRARRLPGRPLTSAVHRRKQAELAAGAGV